MSKPHKHAELIKAWADGAEIQLFDRGLKIWTDTVDNQPAFKEDIEYRIKPTPIKIDYTRLYKVGVDGEVFQSSCWEGWDLKLTFDGETGKLKSAEVLK